MAEMIRLTVVVPVQTWRDLRDRAELERLIMGRASVGAVAAKIIEERLASEKDQPARGER